MRRRIADSVVVVTGASSGIGRATALEFARQGAAVVVAARNEVALAELCEQCHERGGRARCVEADVTDPAALEQVAGRAIEEFGRIDVWVNCAAVTLRARFEDAPIEAYRRVIETNLFGTIYGARAALPYMREQGSGVLINVSSHLSAAPYESAYTASMSAIRGLSESLRQELHGAGIAVVSVLPGWVNTPLFQHAANFSRHGIKPLGPVLEPEHVARAIVHAARAPKREIVLGRSGRRLWRSRQHLPEPPAPESIGNLFSPAPPFGVSGGWHRPRRILRKIAVFGLAAAAPVAIAVAAGQLRARAH